MKKTFFLFIATCMILSVLAQQSTRPGLSPLTRKYLRDIQEIRSKGGERVFAKTEPGGEIQVSALIKVSDGRTAEKGLNKLGIPVGTKAGNIWTVRVPAEKMESFTQVSGIEYIQVDEPVTPDMNVVMITTRTDSVHGGYNLSMPYGGKDVVVGIIDFGFDYNHPSLYDTLGVKYRLKRVWELNGTGAPPQGYTYGNELTDSNLIRAQGTDNPEQTHGAAVAGVAAGSGYGSTGNSLFRGIAYDADLVFVGVRRDSIAYQWMKGGFSDFVDGISYIFKYAESVGKPAVVNISWGSQSGPHDGSTLFNQACDNLSGPGKLVVMSAGNDGEARIHLTKKFTSADTVIHTFLNFSPPIYKRTWVDIWGEEDKTFCARATLYKNGVAGNSTGFICIDDVLHTKYLLGANNQDTCIIEVITIADDFNGKPRVTVTVFNKAEDSVGISVQGTDGTIHLWDESYYYGYTNKYLSEFSSHGKPWAQTGNTQSTVSDMGSAQSVLLVGAYASKVNWTDINGSQQSYSGYVQAGRIVPFSSRGPMVDGRIKPDIASPGLTLATSFSSYDQTYSPTGTNKAKVVSEYTEPLTQKKYYYGEFIGTSASGPVASGIVALMLQANPYISPGQLKDILSQTAIKDNNTGAIPPAGNNVWGHGKINAYGAVKMAIQQAGLYTFAGKKLDCVLYPNPNKGNLTIDYATGQEEDISIEVFDLTGKRVLNADQQANKGTNLFQVDLSDSPRGLYLVRIISAEGSATMKTLVE